MRLDDLRGSSNIERQSGMGILEGDAGVSGLIGREGAHLVPIAFADSLAVQLQPPEI